MPAGLRGAHCPRCLLQVSVATLDPELPTADGQFADFELIEEIARGGSGVVFRARQRSLDRIVAVKMLVAGDFASPETRRRFHAEAEAVARLQHSGIVAIHDIGESDGLPWLSMDYLAGGTLADLVREHPLPAPRAAELVRSIAAAVEHAHAHGVLHRDLKPSNILLDEAGQPRITDFGIARRFDAALALTRTGEVLGSPGYMAPEQAFGDEARISPATDVYGLGALLYHLLTGRPPFQAPTLDAILLQLRDGEPLAPRRLNPAVPRDLETICLRCLRKSAPQRYASAAELAADLKRFLDGETIHARPVSPLEKAWHWCRRNPAAAALLATLFVLAVHVAVSRSQALAIEKQRAEIAERFAREQRRTALLARAQLRLGAIDAGRRGESLRLLREAWSLGLSAEIRSAAITALALPDAVEDTPPSGTVFDAPAPAPENSVPLPAQELVRAWSPAASRLAVAGADKIIYIVDPSRRTIAQRLRGLQGTCLALAFHPAGHWLASVADDQTLRLWDVRTGEELVVAARRRDARERQLQWSADGAWLAVSPGAAFRIVQPAVVRFFHVESPETRTEEVCTIDISSDQRWLVTGTEAGTRLWDVVSQREVALFAKDRHEWSAARFSPDSRRLWIGGWNSKLRAVDLPVVGDRAVMAPRLVADFAGALCAQSVDGEWVVALSNDGGGFEFVSTEPPHRAVWLRHPQPLGIALTRDARLAATSSFGSSGVQLWDFPAQRPLRIFSTAAWQLAFAPDGETLVTCEYETLALWSVATGASTSRTTLDSNIRSLAFAPAGDVLVVETRSGLALIRARAPHDEIARLRTVPARGTASFCFSRDGRQLAIQTDAGGAIVWEFDALKRELAALGMAW
jgi:serine/threonine protein kinase/WD40 repeat protein